MVNRFNLGEQELFVREEEDFEIENGAGENFLVGSFINLESGLRVVVCKTTGLLSQLSIVVPTVSYNEKGLPHTLEHLIFCGSKKYPFKGYIDVLACKNLSYGTNAYTAPDHTSYTYETVGLEGISKVAAKFLEAVVDPALEDNHFVTEVYHFDGDGKQKGVVYSEMKSVEDTEYEKLDQEVRRIMYGENSIYYYGTGGLTKDIAQASNKEIIEYHFQEYQRAKTTVLVVGGVGEDLGEFFEELREFEYLFKKREERVVEKKRNDVAVLQEKVQYRKVKFSSENEEIGSVSCNWIGPEIIDIETKTALNIMSMYMVENGESVLNKRFVETEEPLANHIAVEVSEYVPTWLSIHFEGVELGENRDMGKEYYEMLIEELETTIREKISIDEMRRLIERFKRNYYVLLEGSEVDVMNGQIINAILEQNYGGNSRKGNSSLASLIKESTKIIETIDKLYHSEIDYWKELVKKWFIDNKCVVVVMEPDQELTDKIRKEGEEYETELRKKCSPEYEKNLREVIEKVNNSKLPENIVQEIINSKQKREIPLPFNSNYGSGDCKYIEILSHQFYTISVYIPMERSEFNLYIPLLEALVFNSDIIVKDKIIKYEDLVKRLSEISVSYSSSMGSLISGRSDIFQTHYPTNVVQLGITTTKEHLDECAEILQNCLNISFDKTRIKTVAKQIKTSILESKNNGGYILDCIVSTTLNKEKGGISKDIFDQERVIGQIIRLLEKEDGEEGDQAHEKDGENTEYYDDTSEADVELGAEGECEGEGEGEDGTAEKNDILDVCCMDQVINNLNLLKAEILRSLEESGYYQYGYPKSKTSSGGEENSSSNSNKKLMEDIDSKYNKAKREKIFDLDKTKFAVKGKQEINFTLKNINTTCASFIIQVTQNDVSNHIEEMMGLKILTYILGGRVDGVLYNLVRGNGYGYGVHSYYNIVTGLLTIKYTEITSSQYKNCVDQVHQLISKLIDSEEYFYSVVNELELQLAKSNIIYSSCYLSTLNSSSGSSGGIGGGSSAISGNNLLALLLEIQCFWSSYINTSTTSATTGIDLNVFLTWFKQQLNSIDLQTLRACFVRHYSHFLSANYLNVVVSPPALSSS